MSISILAALGATLFVFIFGLGLAWVWQEHKIKSEDERFRRATSATAQIIEVGTSIIGKSNERISTALRFQVTPSTGKPYKVRSPWVIEPDHIGQIRVGASFSIKIDRQKQNIILPDVAWAQYDWTREHEIEPIYED